MQRWICFLIISGLITSAPADQEGARAIIEAQERREKAFEQVLAAATTNEEKREAFEIRPDPARRVSGLLRELRGQERSAWVVPYYTWIFRRCADIDRRTLEKIRNTFSRHHLRSPGAGKMAIALTHLPDAKSLEIAEAVLVRHADPAEQGAAAFAVSQFLQALGDDAKLTERRLRLIRKAITHSADVEITPGVTVGDLAEDALYRIRFLQNGGKAPDFTANTVEGQAVNLLDKAKEKIVVLCFWASSVKGSKQTAEFFRDMRRALPKDKVEMIGIMPDTRKFIRNLIVQGETTWPSISDLENTLIQKYRIGQLPYCYVIEPGGVVRYSGIANSHVQLTVEGLLSLKK